MTFAVPLPHVFIFQANLSGPPLNPSKVFSDPPILGSRLRLTPPFCSPKTQVIPPKNPPPPPPPQAINNDRSLRAADLKLGGSRVKFSAGARNSSITFLALDFSI